MGSTEEDQRKLDRIPVPGKVSKRPDGPTQAGIDDARDHPVVKIILMVLGAIGVLLIISACALHYRNLDSFRRADGGTVNDRGEKANADEACCAKDDDGMELIAVDELLLGLGVEVTASAVMVFLFFKVLRGKEKADHLQAAFVLTVIAVLSATVPLWIGKGTWNYPSSIIMAFGIEVLGAIIIYALLDNVVEALGSDGETST